MRVAQDEKLEKCGAVGIEWEPIRTVSLDFMILASLHTPSEPLNPSFLGASAFRGVLEDVRGDLSPMLPSTCFRYIFFYCIFDFNSFSLSQRELSSTVLLILSVAVRPQKPSSIVNLVDSPSA